MIGSIAATGYGSYTYGAGNRPSSQGSASSFEDRAFANADTKAAQNTSLSAEGSTAGRTNGKAILQNAPAATQTRAQSSVENFRDPSVESAFKGGKLISIIETIFADLDTNGDGGITVAELNAYAEGLDEQREDSSDTTSEADAFLQALTDKIETGYKNEGTEDGAKNQDDGLGDTITTNDAPKTNQTKALKGLYDILDAVFDSLDTAGDRLPSSLELPDFKQNMPIAEVTASPSTSSSSAIQTIVQNLMSSQDNGETDKSPVKNAKDIHSLNWNAKELTNA
ncbi:hypothetical protein [Pseudophaeobacter sp.]|uniref:hypothetical protein n=1 Tax=Pseudophaeobacter sp. TaxID=1971739 RepID=UPI0032995117